MPSRAERRQAIAEEMLGRMRKSMALMAGKIDGSASDSTLPMIQHMVLHRIQWGEQVSQADLARFLGVTPGYVSTLVDELERTGSVERVRDPGDRRRFHLTVTRKGQSLHQRSHEFLKDAALSVFDSWTDEELEQVNNLLGRLEVRRGHHHPPPRLHMQARPAAPAAEPRRRRRVSFG